MCQVMWLLRYKRMKSEAQGKDRTDAHALTHARTNGMRENSEEKIYKR